jgi:3-methyladenine DNA glycosylase AlkD
MDVSEVMAELEALGSESTRRTFRNHGAPEALFGVKVGDLKGVLKRTKKDHALALALWETGNGDARYLAGLMADERKMTPDELQRWAETADWTMLSEYSVPWMAAESGHGWTLGNRWIDEPPERVASSGWVALGCVVSMVADKDLDLGAIDALLTRVEQQLHRERDRVRYTMNGFVIAVGTYVAPLRERAVAVGAAIDKVQVDVGDTACKVPDAVAYIDKALARGPAKKRKAVRC